MISFAEGQKKKEKKKKKERKKEKEGKKEGMGKGKKGGKENNKKVAPDSEPQRRAVLNLQRFLESNMDHRSKLQNWTTNLDML